MLTHNRTIVLIPCHNEKERIGAVVSSIKDVLPEADIAVIDDDSSDDSAKEAGRSGAIVLRLPVHLGYGSALETGYFYAIKHNYSIVLQMDGDGQHLAEELRSLYTPLLEQKADLVIGSRYLDNADYSDPSMLRRLGQKLFCAIIFFLTGRHFSDPTSGFQGFNKRALTFLCSGVFPCDYPDADVLLMSYMAGLRIHEVSVRMKARVGGKSMHSGLKPLYYGMKMFLSIFIVLLNYRVWHKWRRKFLKDS